ncbi:hypothetical protein DERF_005030 [Dermatophagoides farinae]|uniref:Uncharacterized protein n=1 Tax=Dermatophagoides farinae TaxID=6954 RepID=A0A922L5T1_DERFA|nr:hypothetical protein DERF_005030 [Dermatophagoides farinae]
METQPMIDGFNPPIAQYGHDSNMQSEIKVLFDTDLIAIPSRSNSFQHRVFVRQYCGMEGAHQWSRPNQEVVALYKKQIERVIQITAFKPVNVPASHSLTP